MKRAGKVRVIWSTLFAALKGLLLKPPPTLKVLNKRHLLASIKGRKNKRMNKKVENRYTNEIEQQALKADMPTNKVIPSEF